MHVRWSPKTIWMLLLCSIVIRIGEASNPGPALSSDALPKLPGITIGTINPTGILRKASTFVDLPTREHCIWGLCETHLTSTGIAKFQTELACQSGGFHFHPGAPAPHRSTALSSISGTHTGTGFVTTQPSRRLQATWPQDLWLTARFSMQTFLHNNAWIHGAVIYGHSYCPTSSKTKDQTDQLLSLATDRVVTQLTGYRFITGDFNQEDDLPQIAIWRRLGWREIQEIYEEMTGRPVQVTCRKKTRKDFVWISPELQPYLQQVEILDHFFPDHAVLSAHFSPFGEHDFRYHWRRPKQIDWDVVPSLPDSGFELDFALPVDDLCRTVAEEFENRVHQALLAKDLPGLHHSQRGRCCTLKPQKIPIHSKPLKPSRTGSIQPQFNGLSLQHQRWFTQLRRLESLTKLYHRPAPWTFSQIQHAQREWRAIHKAPGFSKGFAAWWRSLPRKFDHAPDVLPWDLPTDSQLGGILLTFSHEVRCFEHTLQSELRAKAASSRAQNPNKVFRDFAKPVASPIQLLDYSKKATVVEIDPHDHSMLLDCSPDFQDGPLFSSQGSFVPLICSEDAIWVDPANMLPVGSIVSQPHLIGNLDEIFQAFGSEWQKRWDKHLDLPHGFWEPLQQFIDLALPDHEAMTLPEITYDCWIRCLKQKRSRTAPGPDGFSRQDLLHLPRDLTGQILKLLAKIEEGTCQWPTQWTAGLIHCLEKRSHAAVVGDFRPISVFALIYRTWSSIRAKQLLEFLKPLVPHSCCGNIPSKSAAHVWHSLQAMIEDAFVSDSTVAGVTCDIQKCFNNLPREPLIRVLYKLGAHPNLLRGWSKALTVLQRRFSVRGSVGPSHKSSSGFAEGCALSAVSMVGANVLLEAWVKRCTPSCTLWSYVDNLELTASSPQTMLEGFQAMNTLLHALQLPLDVDKTYYWATSSSARKFFKDRSLPVEHACRDLGSQMQYTRVASNSVFTSRISNFQSRWLSLTISPASYKQKLLAIRAVAWAHILHGAGSASLGSAHFDTLRTEALRALGEHKKGASPKIHLSLVENPSFDPEFYAIQATVMLARQQQQPDQCCPILTFNSQLPRRSRARVGPCNVLLERLRSIGWEWDSQGFFVDLVGERIDIWNIPIQALRYALQRDWQTFVACDASHRKSMQGIHDTNALFSLEQKPVDATELSLLRKVLNGTFFTADHLKHHHEDETGLCKLCHAPDSIFHRHWECPAFRSIRQDFPANHISDILALPPATHNHGWFALPDSYSAFWTLHRLLVPDSMQVPLPLGDAVTCLHFFTDGACMRPQDGFARWCAWGVTCCFAPDLWHFHPVCNNLLLGPWQTVVRAEFQAVIEAFRRGFSHGIPFWIWIDNQYVFQMTKYVLAHPHTEWSGRVRNHDLLNELSAIASQCLKFCFGVQKVCSHQNSLGAQDPAERWSFAGNDSADALASRAFSNYPKLLDAWNHMCTDLAHCRALRQTCHKLFTRIGEESIKQHTPVLPSEPATVPFRPPAPLEMIPWQFPDTEIPNRFVIPELTDIFTWVASLHSDGAVTQRWSWWELYIDACLQCPSIGPWYDSKRQCWRGGDSAPSAPFLKRARSFSKFLTQLAKHLDLKLPTALAVPASAHLAFWTNTLPVCTVPARQLAIDSWLGVHISGAAKTADLRCVP